MWVHGRTYTRSLYWSFYSLICLAHVYPVAYFVELLPLYSRSLFAPWSEQRPDK